MSDFIAQLGRLVNIFCCMVSSPALAQCLLVSVVSKFARENYFTRLLHLSHSSCQWCEKNSLTFQALFFLLYCKKFKMETPSVKSRQKPIKFFPDWICHIWSWGHKVWLQHSQILFQLIQKEIHILTEHNAHKLINVQIYRNLIIFGHLNHA